MKCVEKDTVVRLEYHVLDDAGVLVDCGRRPIVYLHRGYGELFPVLEAALEGKTVGQSIEVLLTPDNSLGEYDEKLQRVEDRERLPPDIAEGVLVGCHSPEGERVFRIHKILDDVVLLDGNHRFAGKTLKFIATVAEIRDASPREIANGEAKRLDD